MRKNTQSQIIDSGDERKIFKARILVLYEV